MLLYLDLLPLLYLLIFFLDLNRRKIGSVGRADDAWREITRGGGRGGCWSM